MIESEIGSDAGSPKGGPLEPVSHSRLLPAHERAGAVPDDCVAQQGVEDVSETYRRRQDAEGGAQEAGAA